MSIFNHCILTFASVAHAMRFEKLMKSEKIEFKLIPVPRSISVSCGICAKFPAYQKDRVLKLSEENNIIYQKVFMADDDMTIDLAQ